MIKCLILIFYYRVEIQPCQRMEYSSVAALSLIIDLISRMQIIFLSSMEVLGAGGGGLVIGDGDGGDSKNVQHETFKNITFSVNDKDTKS